MIRALDTYERTEWGTNIKSKQRREKRKIEGSQEHSTNLTFKKNLFASTFKNPDIKGRPPSAGK